MQAESNASSSRGPASLAVEVEPMEPSAFAEWLERLRSRTVASREAGEFFFEIDERLLIDSPKVTVGEFIGQGPNSFVYQGLYNNMPVAVKIIQPTEASNVEADRKEKFQREALLLANLKHESIVKFFGATVDPSLMLVTELMGGGTLQKHLWSVRPQLLNLKLAMTYALDISRAMEYLHARGIIHRDLNPSKILLNEDKTRIKLADFDLARDLSADTTFQVGTYRWMAPEMHVIDANARSNKKYDHKVDVYSFSIVLWELLVNKTPFKGNNNYVVAYATINNVRPPIEEIPNEILPLLQACWSEDPKSRPEFRDVTEYLHTLYHNLYPPEAKPKPNSNSRVFDIENLPNDSFDMFLNNNIANDNVDNVTNDIIEEVPPEGNDNQAQDDQVVTKKNPTSKFLRCFTCSHVSD